MADYNVNDLVKLGALKNLAQRTKGELDSNVDKSLNIEAGAQVKVIESVSVDSGVKFASDTDVNAMLTEVFGS